MMEINKLKEQNKKLKAELEKLEHIKAVAEKNEKSKETVHFVEPLKIDDETFESLTFRRPTGGDVAAIMGVSHPADRIHQLARLLCSELNDVDDEEFREMDYGHHYKYIVKAVEGFM
jgi:hypothetical protein